MDDHEVIKHLLNIESEAAALVRDAQAEADRRISGEENQNRVRHDEIYAEEAAVLEASYANEINAARENYRKQLEDYRISLTTMPLNLDAFSLLAKKFLFEDVPPRTES